MTQAKTVLDMLSNDAHDTLIDIVIAAGGPVGSTGNHARLYSEAALCELVDARLIRIATSGIVRASMSTTQYDALVGGFVGDG
jgi:hypothetical protein